MFGILSMFSVLGGTLYERRDELGIETRRSPERTAERLRLEDLEESEARVTEAYGQMRVPARMRRPGRCSRAGSPREEAPSRIIAGCAIASPGGVMRATPIA